MSSLDKKKLKNLHKEEKFSCLFFLHKKFLFRFLCFLLFSVQKRNLGQQKKLNRDRFKSFNRWFVSDGQIFAVLFPLYEENNGDCFLYFGIIVWLCVRVFRKFLIIFVCVKHKFVKNVVNHCFVNIFLACEINFVIIDDIKKDWNLYLYIKIILESL